MATYLGMQEEATKLVVRSWMSMVCGNGEDASPELLLRASTNSRRPRPKGERGKVLEDAPGPQKTNGKDERGSGCRTLPEKVRLGVAVAALRRGITAAWRLGVVRGVGGMREGVVAFL